HQLTPTERALLETHEAHFALARGRSASEPNAVEIALIEAALRLHAVGAGPEVDDDDVQWAMRLLRHAMKRLAAGLPRRRPRGACAVSVDGARCIRPDGRTIDLSRRIPLRAVLLHLCLARLTRAPMPASSDELFAAGWPG